MGSAACWKFRQLTAGNHYRLLLVEVCGLKNMQRAITVKESGKITSNLFCSFFGDKSSNKIFEDKQGAKEYLSIKLLLSNWRSYSTLGVAFDWEIQILKWNAKSENGFPLWNPSSGWIAIKKSKSGFHGFPFYRSIGKSEKRFAKPFSWTAVFFLLIMRAQARPLILRTVFQILFRISQSNGKKEIQKQISQRWNLFSDFAFDCRSEIRFLKSESRFPNRTHPKESYLFRSNTHFQLISAPHVSFP